MDYLEPGLRADRLIDEDTLPVHLDATTDYELTQAQAQAELDGAEARLAELELREDNIEASLEIARRKRDLAAEELQRQQVLLERGAISKAVVDQAEEAFLQQRSRVQELENELRLLPVQQRVPEAERAAAEARLAEARRNITRTHITMPFGGRIAEVMIERDQYVAVGEILLVAENLDDVEVSAPVRLSEARAFFADRLPVQLAELGIEALDRLPAAIGLEAELRLDIGAFTVTWPAMIRRFSFALDPATRTIGIIVGVDQPFQRTVTGERPPLIRDMFVEVVLRGPAIRQALVVPRAALVRAPDRGWQVHLADAEHRLERRAVEVAYEVNDMAVISEGLAAGERVVLSDLPRAIEGMLLDVHHAVATEAARQQAVTP